jgi:hypothetical protein
MGQRLQLQALLEQLIGPRSDGRDNVYFQPPATVELNYPCIIYRLSDVNTAFANDSPYITNKQYQITVIDIDPDSLIPDKIGKLPKCIFDRTFTANNLNHSVYNIYY